MAKLGNSEKNLEDVRALPMREMGGGPKYFLLGTYIVGWSDTALYCDFRKRPLLYNVYVLPIRFIFESPI